jgi:hypothetical protein
VLVRTVVRYEETRILDLLARGLSRGIAVGKLQDSLRREMQGVIQQATRMTNQIKGPADAWGLKHYLTERRKEIDRKYDYRYSQLTRVFRRLLYEGRVSEEELRGLRDDKLKSIRSLAEFSAKYAALTWNLSAMGSYNQLPVCS